MYLAQSRFSHLPSCPCWSPSVSPAIITSAMMLMSASVIWLLVTSCCGGGIAHLWSIIMSSDRLLSLHVTYGAVSLSSPCYISPVTSRSRSLDVESDTFEWKGHTAVYAHCPCRSISSAEEPERRRCPLHWRPELGKSGNDLSTEPPRDLCMGWCIGSPLVICVLTFLIVDDRRGPAAGSSRRPSTPRIEGYLLLRAQGERKEQRVRWLGLHLPVVAADLDVHSCSIAYVECHSPDHATTLKTWFDSK